MDTLCGGSRRFFLGIAGGTGLSLSGIDVEGVSTAVDESPVLDGSLVVEVADVDAGLVLADREQELVLEDCRRGKVDSGIFLISLPRAGSCRPLVKRNQSDSVNIPTRVGTWTSVCREPQRHAFQDETLEHAQSKSRE